MCGISGIYSLDNVKISNLNNSLLIMNDILRHRGPDAERIWIHPDRFIGFAHRRLSIIDLVSGDQPITNDAKNTIAYNGEIYNYMELHPELKGYSFYTKSDTEVILAAYHKWGLECVNHLRGMFAFMLWDESKHELICARDRFGIKPLYYTIQNNVIYFASETKALLPFLKSIDTDMDGLKDYFIFQFVLGEKTMFKGVKQLLPGHMMVIKNGDIHIHKYWDVHYKIDWDHTKKYFQNTVRDLIQESVQYHMRSDVPVGAYLSGGLDSSIVSIMASRLKGNNTFKVFTGKFGFNSDFDESAYAKDVANQCDFEYNEIDIKPSDFIENIRKVIYHLDYPVAGPGSFPQYMVSKLASQHLKVVLGGQGGDEVFGGYVRYLLAYFEQCIKGAIDGTMKSGNYIVTYESIIQNLTTLKKYKPMMQEFWNDGLFDERDKRYFKLINRSNTLANEINWDIFESYSAFETFKSLFWVQNVEKESYFDSMTHFDFKTLLPSLLHVEDRMSMAHGLESRVPLLDHPLIEFVATIPSNIKFENGMLKRLLKTVFADILPVSVSKREDKMGFPVPLSIWMRGALNDFIGDIFNSKNAKERCYLNPRFDLGHLISQEGKFSRNLWGLLCLELWQEEYHDKSGYYTDLINKRGK